MRLGSQPPTDAGPTVTDRLLERAREGDRSALDALFTRQLPGLLRWARGRLPRWARSATDTADIVQDTALKSLRRLDAFESRRRGALQAYLRQAVQNRIRDECRRAVRQPVEEELSETAADERPSPLEVAIGREASERYRRCLARLRPEDQELIVARVELAYGYEQIAAAFGKPSPDAARVAVSRALLRLAEGMARDRG